MEDRNANRDELRPLLIERLQNATRMEWFRDIIAAGVPCGPINDVSEVWASPPRSGSTRSSRSARASRWCRRCATRSRSPRRRSTTAAAPRLDEHGEEIRRWLFDEAGPDE
jgi:crotonobetainyl-CoA:carnitine CoA-transferase CaiB-like acyl-CoA transferase